MNERRGAVEEEEKKVEEVAFASGSVTDSWPLEKVGHRGGKWKGGNRWNNRKKGLNLIRDGVWCMCVFVCVHVCLCARLHMRVFLSGYVCLCVRVHMRVYVSVCIAKLH